MSLGFKRLNVVILPHVMRLVLNDPKTVTTPEIIHQIDELILEYRRISAKSVAEQMGISRDRIGSIILECLDMRKISAKWVPKCLNADQKRQRCQSSEQLLEFFRRDTNNFLSRMVTWLDGQTSNYFEWLAKVRATGLGVY